MTKKVLNITLKLSIIHKNLLTFLIGYDMMSMLGRLSAASFRIEKRCCHSENEVLRSRRIYKKKSIAALLAGIGVLSVLLLSGCNKQMVDLTYSYEYAIIGLPNGEVVEGKVSSWTDFEDGDQIQVRIDGKTYLVHSSNVVLISD